MQFRQRLAAFPNCHIPLHRYAVMFAFALVVAGLFRRGFLERKIKPTLLSLSHMPDGKLVS